MLACESKHVGLVAMGLACVQKMTANGAVHHEKYLSILQALQQVRFASRAAASSRTSRSQVRR